MTPAGLAHLGRAGKQTLACAAAAELSADRITRAICGMSGVLAARMFLV